MTDRPWFIRIRTPFSYRLEPYSLPGWIATIVFVLGALGLGLSRDHLFPPGRTGWVVWGVLFATWLIGYLVLAFRNSERAEVLLPGTRG